MKLCNCVLPNLPSPGCCEKRGGVKGRCSPWRISSEGQGHRSDVLWNSRWRARSSGATSAWFSSFDQAFAECSEDLHELLNSLAESKTKYLCRMKGEVESEWKVASNLTYLRRQLSVCGVRSVADSLLCRLQQAGPAGRGAAAAARRRARWARRGNCHTTA